MNFRCHSLLIGLIATASLTSQAMLRAESAPLAAPTPNPPAISFSPPTGLLSQVAPKAEPPSAPEISFPSIEALIAETTAAAPTGEAFYDPEYGLRGRLPTGWKLRDSARWATKELQYVFDVADYPLALPRLYYRKFPERRTVTPEQMIEWLQQEALARARQRITLEKLTDYRARKGMIRTIGEHQAMTWLSDYTNLGERWIEFTTQIHSLDGAVMISLNAPARNMAALFPQLEAVVQSITVP